MSSTPRNPFAYAEPITLDTLGDLFNHHRSLTGGWSMTATPPEPAPTPPAPTPPAPAPAPTPPPAPPAAYTPPATQADLDKILGERLAREREKYADYAELQRKAAEHDAAVEAAKTEAQKAIDAARKEGETTATTAANTRVVRAEAKAAAATAKFRDPEIAVKLLDLTGVTVSDDGTVDAAALKVKLDELATSHPYLVDDGAPTPKPGPRPDPSQGGGGGGEEKPTTVAEARRIAREQREAKAPKTA